MLDAPTHSPTPELSPDSSSPSSTELPNPSNAGETDPYVYDPKNPPDPFTPANPTDEVNPYTPYDPANPPSPVPVENIPGENPVAPDSSSGNTPSPDGSLASVYEQAQAIDRALGRGGSESPSTATESSINPTGESSTGPTTGEKRPFEDDSSTEAGPSTKKGKEKAG